MTYRRYIVDTCVSHDRGKFECIKSSRIFPKIFTSMSDLIVLGNSQVHDLLIALSKSDIHLIKNEIAESLVQFSTGSEQSYQPEPGIVVRPDGQKVLFRSFTSIESVGVKIIVEPPSRSAVALASQQPHGSKPPALAPLRGLVAVCDKEGRASRPKAGSE